jgi:TrmH family RNA methyltransferase
VATIVDGGTDYTHADLSGRVALLLGNEAHGLPAEVARLADEYVTIPLAGRTESLNVGMAASVLCFEAARQRRGRP